MNCSGYECKFVLPAFLLYSHTRWMRNLQPAELALLNSCSVDLPHESLQHSQPLRIPLSLIPFSVSRARRESAGPRAPLAPSGCRAGPAPRDPRDPPERRELLWVTTAPWKYPCAPLIPECCLLPLCSTCILTTPPYSFWIYKYVHRDTFLFVLSETRRVKPVTVTAGSGYKSVFHQNFVPSHSALEYSVFDISFHYYFI